MGVLTRRLDPILAVTEWSPAGELPDRIVNLRDVQRAGREADWWSPRARSDSWWGVFGVTLKKSDPAERGVLTCRPRCYNANGTRS